MVEQTQQNSIQSRDPQIDVLFMFQLPNEIIRKLEMIQKRFSLSEAFRERMRPNGLLTQSYGNQGSADETPTQTFDANK